MQQGSEGIKTKIVGSHKLIYLGKERVGVIKPVQGYQYFPKGYTQSDGQIFLTMAECEKSLHDDD